MSGPVDLDDIEALATSDRSKLAEALLNRACHVIQAHLLSPALDDDAAELEQLRLEVIELRRRRADEAYLRRQIESLEAQVQVLTDKARMANARAEALQDRLDHLTALRAADRDNHRQPGHRRPQAPTGGLSDDEAAMLRRLKER